jgi:protein-tyrosine phosphatase
VVATPHHANGKYDNKANSVMTAVDRLNRELQEHRIPLEVLYGQEIRVYSDLLGDLSDGGCITINQSKYILLEMPSHKIPSSMFELLHELNVMKLVPIIAHPERNKEIASDPDKLRGLVERGALSQITSHSVNGGFGRKIRELCLDLCRRHLVHFVATDAHDIAYRPCQLRNAYEYIREKLGDRYARYYQENAASVVNNGFIDVWEPQAGKRHWFPFWK